VRAITPPIPVRVLHAPQPWLAGSPFMYRREPNRTKQPNNQHQHPTPLNPPFKKNRHHFEFFFSCGFAMGTGIPLSRLCRKARLHCALAYERIRHHHGDIGASFCDSYPPQQGRGISDGCTHPALIGNGAYRASDNYFPQSILTRAGSDNFILRAGATPLRGLTTFSHSRESDNFFLRGHARRPRVTSPKAMTPPIPLSGLRALGGRGDELKKNID
jgi:hypothetical protein